MDPELLPIPSEWPNAEALFRAQIVAPLLDPLSSPEERRQWRTWVTSRAHTLPQGSTRRISERTLRRWVAESRQTAGLPPARRPQSNRGVLRKLSPEMLERAKALKSEDPRRSAAHVLRILETEQEEAIDITPGALWRHLAKAGLGGRSPIPSDGYERWEAKAPNAIWQSDVKHGPYLPDPLNPERMRKTYLIGFLDDYSRCVMHAEWYWAEDVYALELCFQKALLRKGKPHRVYVDRGLIYQSRVFRMACAHLDIHHISATSRRPQGKGKIERLWLTIDNDFLVALEHEPVDTLEELNRRFWAWLDEVYHQRVHRSIGMTPLARYVSRPVQRLEHPERLSDLFLWEAVRKVDKTSCVSFQGNVYQLEPGLELRKVTLRYHPLRLDVLQVWTGEKRWPDATPLDLKHDRVKSVNPRHQGAEAKAAPTHFLETLVRQNTERKRRIISPLQLSRGGEAGV